MGHIPQAEFNTGSSVRRAALSGSGAKNAQGPGQKQKAGGPGGRRGGGGGAGDIQAEASAVDSLIGQLPSNLQGAYQSSLQSIMNERGGDKRTSLQSLQTAIQDALDMLQNSENGEENDGDLPETGGANEGNPSIAQAFRGAKPGGGSRGIPPAALAVAGKNAALAAPPPAFMRLSARA